MKLAVHFIIRISRTSYSYSYISFGVASIRITSNLMSVARQPSGFLLLSMDITALGEGKGPKLDYISGLAYLQTA